MPRSAEEIAKRYHEVYEELAPTMGSMWEAQITLKKWEDLPTEQRWLMVKVIDRLIDEKMIYRGKESKNG